MKSPYGKGRNGRCSELLTFQNKMPTEAALLWLLTDDPGDEPSITPKLNCGAFEKLLGFFDSFAVVFANEEPVPDKMNLGSDEIGPVMLHGAAPLH